MNYFEEQEYEGKFNMGLWGKIYQHIKVFKKEMAIIISSMTMLALCDVLFPLLSKFAIDHMITPRDTSLVPVFIAAYVALIIFQCANVYRFVYHGSAKLETSTVYTLRKKGFDKLQALSFSYYDTTPVGWIMARMTSDAQRIGDVIAWGCVDLIWGSAVVVFAIVSMFILYWKLALLVMIILPPLAVASVYFQNKIFAQQRTVRKINSRITGAFNEGINGARTTKTLIREEKNFEEFDALTEEMRGASIRSAILSSLFLPVVLSLGSIGVAIAIWRGGVSVMGGVMTIGTLTVFINYTVQIFDPIQQIARVFADLQSAQASAERTLALIETEPDIIDRADVIEKYGDAANPKPETWPELTGDIVFDGVSFSYKTGEKVLEDFSLHVKAGEKIALVGETGSGKSTIVNLICRFYEPVSGKILIDGVDYRERPQIWLQSNLGYVLQQPHLFSGSVKDNIRYSKLDATDEEVISAAKAVNAYDFVMKLEKGFDTEVGEGGGRLSSGEKQLISFARAILANPKLFVLDEATAYVDTETEQMIQRAVDSSLSGRTSFIIAHRLSTIRSCDRILVIDKGNVIESGSHRELMHAKGHYHDLYMNQFKQEAEDRLLA